MARDRSISLLCLCAGVDMLAASMTVTVLASYLTHSLALSASQVRARPHSIAVAVQAGAVLSIYGVVQFFSSPVVGGYSDVYGHRRTLGAALVVCALAYA